MPIRHAANALLLAAALGFGPALSQDVAIETGERRIYSIQGEFEFYREMLESAITDEGLVINVVGDIGGMLDRTGSDLGAEERLYIHAHSLEFCSALFSRRMMESDPHSVVFCPYVIAIYELAAEPGTVYMGYQRMPIVGDDASQSALQDVEDLMDRIVNNALSF